MYPMIFLKATRSLDVHSYFASLEMLGILFMLVHMEVWGNENRIAAMTNRPIPEREIMILEECFTSNTLDSVIYHFESWVVMSFRFV